MVLAIGVELAAQKDVAGSTVVEHDSGTGVASGIDVDEGAVLSRLQHDAVAGGVDDRDVLKGALGEFAEVERVAADRRAVEREAAARAAEMADGVARAKL